MTTSLSDRADARELLEALIPLKIRWVSQASINTAMDPEFLQLLKASGCQGLLIGFESMNPDNLRQMGKGVNLAQGDFEQAMANLRKYGIRVYGTFVFGYDNDTPETFDRAYDFAVRHGLYLCGFNHLMPMPGTPLYQRLEKEGRLLHDAWWLDDAYTYNTVPFRPARMSPEEIRNVLPAGASAFLFTSDHLAPRLSSVQPLGLDVLQGILRLEPASPGRDQQTGRAAVGRSEFSRPTFGGGAMKITLIRPRFAKGYQSPARMEPLALGHSRRPHAQRAHRPCN